jgi:hypothetical protein
MDNKNGTTYTEAAIFVSTQGPFMGEYIAACASDSCGYLGKLCKSHTFSDTADGPLVCVERMYSRSGLFINKYPHRGELCFFAASVQPLICSYRW